MLSKITRELTERDHDRHNYRMDALAIYYREGNITHPDPCMTEHVIVLHDSDEEETRYSEYIRLANEIETLAVYRRTARGELKRLKRWPQPVEDGTAITYSEMRKLLKTRASQATTEPLTTENNDFDDFFKELGLAA